MSDLKCLTCRLFADNQRFNVLSLSDGFSKKCLVESKKTFIFAKEINKKNKKDEKDFWIIDIVAFHAGLCRNNGESSTG